MGPIETFLRAMVEMRIAHGRAPAGRYTCIEEYLLAKGHAYAPLKLTPREAAFVRDVRARGRYPIKQCFSNSMRVILDQWLSGDPLDGITVKYAEGYVLRTSLPIPIHHAWLDVNGKVVDLTLRRKGGAGPLLSVGDYGAEAHYFGATFGLEDVRRFTVETQTYGSLLDDWKRGWPYMQIGYKP